MVLPYFPFRVIMPSPSGSFADAAFAGILGGDILERFEVTLDLQHAFMYLKPDAGFRRTHMKFVTVGIQFSKRTMALFPSRPFGSIPQPKRLGSWLGTGSFRSTGAPRPI
jgi:hypothetical protein